MKLIVNGGTVVPLSSPRAILEETDIYVDAGLIVGVGPEAPPFPPAAADKVIHAAGCLVLPGFVNAHNHLALALLRGWGSHPAQAFRAHLTEEDYYIGALLSMAEMIRGGTTSFADTHHQGPEDLPVTDILAQATEASGLRGCLCLEVQAFVASRTAKGVRLTYHAGEAQRTLKESLAFAQRWQGQGEGRITTMLGIANPPVPPAEVLTQVARSAREWGFGIHLHLAEIAREMDEWRQRYDAGPAEALRRTGVLETHVLGGNCIFLSEEDARILREYEFHATTCPQNCCKALEGMLDVPMLLRHGVNVALGTNDVSNNDNLDLIEEMRLAALYHRLKAPEDHGMEGDAPLRLITENGGRALGLDVGTIEVGRKADLVIMDAQGPHMHPRHDLVANVTYAAAAADVRTVLVDGRPVMEERRILTFDETAVIAEVEARLAPLRENLNLDFESTPPPPTLDWIVG